VKKSLQIDFFPLFPHTRAHANTHTHTIYTAITMLEIA